MLVGDRPGVLGDHEVDRLVDHEFALVAVHPSRGGEFPRQPLDERIPFSHERFGYALSRPRASRGHASRRPAWALLGHTNTKPPRSRFGPRNARSHLSLRKAVSRWLPDGA